MTWVHNLAGWNESRWGSCMLEFLQWCGHVQCPTHWLLGGNLVRYNSIIEGWILQKRFNDNDRTLTIDSAKFHMFHSVSHVQVMPISAARVEKSQTSLSLIQNIQTNKKAGMLNNTWESVTIGFRGVYFHAYSEFMFTFIGNIYIYMMVCKFQSSHNTHSGRSGRRPAFQWSTNLNDHQTEELIDWCGWLAMFIIRK